MTTQSNRILTGQRGIGGYSIVADSQEVDLLSFRSLRAEAKKKLLAGRNEEAAVELKKAIAIWRGPFGEDLANTGRLTAIARGVNNERTLAVEQLGRVAITIRNVGEAIQLLDRHVNDSPTRESGWVLLACAHYMNGNPAIAQSTVRRACQALSEEVGLLPSADLRAAENAAVRHDDRWFQRHLGSMR
ncbi:hypothetical protein JQS43_24925 [Natronosporangium hydrolyticum]|uniref:Bacterial transcriptional activator domain-containing protein n=1 Tax=Natronosporangium hydrolyticum TaxID=2811111 RepID=A0A895YEV0_9ACTN|nr:BTAD domain-containing putative transcriptional regulator [Natronosporangium hydrolyticum]QSB14665.1 hypothetical protein JQS43_24925 [Natronosporangium hydrolyticum]